MWPCCYTAFRLPNRTEIYGNELLIEDYDWDVAHPMVFLRISNGSTVDVGSVRTASFGIVIVGFASVTMAALAERRVRGCAE
jgi:hypothetical protein